MFNNNGSGKTRNKVYINPNFNKPPINSHSNTVMHVNPRFPHLLPNTHCSVLDQPPSNNKAKIFVNPIFMKSNNEAAFQLTKTIDINYSKEKRQLKHNNAYSQNCYQQTVIEDKGTTLSVPIKTSRYSLVRQHAYRELQGTVVKKPNTVQVSKYKSIQINHLKKKLDDATNKRTITSHIEKEHVVSSNKQYLEPATSNANNNIIKLVNRKIDHVSAIEKFKAKMCVNTKKNILHQMRIKKVKGNLKKNNIPCPMFRKFGKCLRQIRGNCEFLHDKKHVAICRKFVKGLCHDKHCLLSHDLSTKKMPTCYFYLQGTCNKSDCPYLHVKLSEKVKVCPDFLKGYCEKGSTCLQRHINIHTEKKVKVTKSSKNKFIKVKIKNKDPIDATGVTNGKKFSTVEKNANNMDRYYQEHKDDVNASSTCEVIKPMRCKLGTLPSFIEL